MALLATNQRALSNAEDNSQDGCSYCGFTNHVVANCRKRKCKQNDS